MLPKISGTHKILSHIRNSLLCSNRAHTKTGLLPFSSSAWYSGHNTTQAEDHSLPCLSLEAYGSPGGRDYGILDTPLADSQK